MCARLKLNRLELEQASREIQEMNVLVNQGLFTVDEAYELIRDKRQHEKSTVNKDNVEVKNGH